MSNWNLDHLRKIAGLTESHKSKAVALNESDEYDDEDPDVKIAGEDKRQKAFEKRNKGELKTANKIADEKTKAQKAAKTAEKKPEAEKPQAKPAENAPEKKAEAAAEAKRRGKAPNENSFNQQAKAHARSHSRASFLKWAQDTHGKGKHYASALFAKYNPKSSREVKEAAELWAISHPYLKGYMLAENREMNQLQWVDGTSPFDPVMYVSEAEAKKVAKYMEEWKSQACVIEHFDFSDLDDEDQKKT